MGIFLYEYWVFIGMGVWLLAHEFQILQFGRL